MIQQNWKVFIVDLLDMFFQDKVLKLVYGNKMVVLLSQWNVNKEELL